MSTVLLHQIPEATRRALVRMADQPLDRQAQKLGLTRKTIQAYRSVMIRAGALAPRFRPTRPDDAARIARLAALGYSAPGIAGCVGVSVRRVLLLARAHGIAIGHAPDIWTVQGAADLFDVTHKMVRLWRRQGWLDATPISGGGEGRRGTRWAIRRADLVRFLHERQAWPTYEPRRIADPDLRELAARLRELAGGRWAGLSDLADAAGLVPTAVIRRLAYGWLAGWEQIHVAGRRYVWWPDGATLPVFSERSRWGTRRSTRVAAAD